MWQQSFEVAGFWAIVAFGSVAGNMLAFWGFGNASKRMNKRVREGFMVSLTAFL
jgi:hypothetical protein